MNYELAKQLKDAGFPQKPDSMMPLCYCEEGKEPMQVPTLSELIKACGEGFSELTRLDLSTGLEWEATSYIALGQKGETPEEVVAKLYIELNKKK